MRHSTKLHIRRWLLMGLFHLVIMAGAFILTIALGSGKFDNPELPQSRLETAASLVSEVFRQPATSILDIIGYKGLVPYLDWIFLYLNSLLWAAPFALVWARLTKRSTRTQPLLSTRPQ